jgi:hypothetical protein
VAVPPDRQSRRHPPVGNQHIEPVQGQFGQQHVDMPLPTNQAYGIVEAGHRRERAAGDRFRHHIGDADPQHGQRLALARRQCRPHLVVELEDLVRIRRRHAPVLGQLGPTPGGPERRHTKALFELAHLTAGGLRGQVEPFGGLGDTAHAAHGREIAKMPEIHTTSPFTELLIRNIRLFQHGWKPYRSPVATHE